MVQDGHGDRIPGRGRCQEKSRVPGRRGGLPVVLLLVAGPQRPLRASRCLPSGCRVRAVRARGDRIGVAGDDSRLAETGGGSGRGKDLLPPPAGYLSRRPLAGRIGKRPAPGDFPAGRVGSRLPSSFSACPQVRQQDPVLHPVPQEASPDPRADLYLPFERHGQAKGGRPAGAEQGAGQRGDQPLRVPPLGRGPVAPGAARAGLQLRTRESHLLFRTGHLHRRKGPGQPRLSKTLRLPFSGPSAERSCRPCRLRHRHLPRPGQTAGRRQRPGVHRARLPRRRQALRAR